MQNLGDKQRERTMGDSKKSQLGPGGLKCIALCYLSHGTKFLLKTYLQVMEPFKW